MTCEGRRAPGISRRAALGALGAMGAIGVAGAGGAASLLGGCARREAVDEVVLYSSVDDFVLREVVAAFEDETGLRVRLLGDTEATKTTGLVERLIAERDEPRADVWWSSEPFGTIRLGGLGLLEPAEIDPPPVVYPGLAGRLDAPDGSWYGFALRARVLAVREGSERPRRLAELTEERFAGRVGIARPRFGTTRGHMAALLTTFGEPAFRGWLEAMAANGMRIYDGNSTVVRAVSEGEIDVCLTDTDDVWVAQANGRAVVAVYEVDDGAPVGGGTSGALPSVGPMLIPNTVARVRGGPNEDAALRLMRFLLEGPAEEVLARSDSHNIPARREPFPDLERFAAPDGWLPDLRAVAARDEAAMAICDEVLGEG